MCGFVGRCHWDNVPVDRDLLARQIQTLLHRGPDEAGLWTDGPFGLAMRRLKVIDLVGGQQPMSNRSCPRRAGTLRLVYNGEIYNAPLLRQELESRGHHFVSRSDTEVILHGFEEWGHSLWEKLNGMFALAIFDEQARRLTLVRDRQGIKPLYFLRTSSGIQFASELRPFWQDPTVTANVDPNALREFLSQGHVSTPGCFYQGIRKLTPGTYLTLDADSADETPRDFAGFFRPSQRRSRSEGLAILDQAIATAVQRQLAADVPLGVCLSGGLDSAMVAYYARHHRRNIAGFHIDFGSPTYSERSQAEATARRWGLHLHTWEMPTPHPDQVERVLSRLDEPVADPSVLPSDFLFEKVRGHVTVALSGDGGDEIFAGYPTYLADRCSRWYRKSPLALRGALEKIVEAIPVSFRRMSWDFKLKSFFRAAGQPQPAAHRGWQELFSSEEIRCLIPGGKDRLPDGDLLADAFARAFAEAGGIDDLTTWMWMDRRTHLLDRYLVKVDRLSMAHSLEVRVPLLDNDVVDAAARLADDDKLGWGTTKLPLRRLLQGRIPSDVLRGGKKGFAPPLAEWLAGPLYAWAEAKLSRASLERCGLIGGDWPLLCLQEHRARRRDHSRRLWALLTLTTHSR